MEHTGHAGAGPHPTASHCVPPALCGGRQKMGDWTKRGRAEALQHLCPWRLCQRGHAAARPTQWDNHHCSHHGTSNYLSSSLPALYPRIEQEDQEGHLNHLILGQCHHNYKVLFFQWHREKEEGTRPPRSHLLMSRGQPPSEAPATSPHPEPAGLTGDFHTPGAGDTRSGARNQGHGAFRL